MGLGSVPESGGSGESSGEQDVESGLSEMAVVGEHTPNTATPHAANRGHLGFRGLGAFALAHLRELRFGDP